MSEAPVTQKEYPLDTSWMQHMGEWGMHAEPGKRGLTLEEIKIGSYGDVPKVSHNMTGRPRGAGVRPDAYRVGAYGVRSKSEIWLASLFVTVIFRRKRVSWSRLVMIVGPKGRRSSMAFLP